MMAVIGVSTIFCFIGLATPGWGHFFYSGALRGKVFVFSIYVPLATGPLAIISLLLLIVSLVGLILIFLKKLQHPYAPIGIIVLMILTTFFLLGTFASFFSFGPAAIVSSTLGNSVYSINLIITAFTFTYLTSIIGTYWLASVHGDLLNIQTESTDHSSKIEEHANDLPEAF